MKHHALTDKARSLVSQIAKLDAELLETLNAIYAEQIYKAEGYDNMHKYCVDCLGMGGGEAYRKLQAAKLMERHPAEVRGLLESGQANLTHLAMIESVVTPTNATQMFAEVRGKSTREVERMLRREDPKDDVREAVEHVTTPRKESIELLAPDHWALRAMMDDATKAIYDDVLDLLTFEQRTPGEVLKRALAELKERLMVQKRRKLRSAAKTTATAHATERPPTALPQPEKPLAEQPSTASPSTAQPPTASPPTGISALIHGELVGPAGATRYVSADIARIVFERDNYQCQFVSLGGHKCCTTRDLHLHHIIAWAKGGETAPENLKVYCRCHNLYQGELDFGPRERAA